MTIKLPKASAAHANAEPEGGFDMSYRLGTIALSMPLKKLSPAGRRVWIAARWTRR